MKDNIPFTLHKDIYHSLFESHLTYGITVWGDVAESNLLPLFRAQKKCLRIVFGDKEAYLEKFNTCARRRTIGRQKLNSTFYAKEHSKPLFNDNKILTVYNLYTYHSITNTHSIIKFRTPISLFTLFTLSNRHGRETLLTTPHPRNKFLHSTAATWNTARKKIKVTELSFNHSLVKTSTKALLLKQQNIGNRLDWIALNHKFA